VERVRKVGGEWSSLHLRLVRVFVYVRRHGKKTEGEKHGSVKYRTTHETKRTNGSQRIPKKESLAEEEKKKRKIHIFARRDERGWPFLPKSLGENRAYRLVRAKGNTLRERG